MTVLLASLFVPPWLAATAGPLAADKAGEAEDEDGDGVVDLCDDCKGTPEHVPVDRHGCPFDRDDDGVPDHRDACLGTPRFAQGRGEKKVDGRGCPLDDDGDGVANYLDACPETRRERTVDYRGCEPAHTHLANIVSKTGEVVLPVSIHFDFDSHDLDQGDRDGIPPEVVSMLDDVAQALNQDRYEVLRVRVIGHTDYRGTAEYNRGLALKRAERVRQALEGRGVDEDRISIFGLGEEHPLEKEDPRVDEATERGRVNRRVSLEFWYPPDDSR